MAENTNEKATRKRRPGPVETATPTFIAYADEIADLLNQGMSRQDIYTRLGAKIGVGMTQFNNYVRRFIGVRYTVRKGEVRKAMEAETLGHEAPPTAPAPSPQPGRKEPESHAGKQRKSIIANHPSDAAKYA